MYDYTHFVMIYLPWEKYEFSRLKEYICEAEAKWEVEKICCDNERKYVSHDLAVSCEAKGTVLGYNLPYTPSLNLIVERLNKMGCLLFDLNLEKEMWGKSLLTAAYSLNRNLINVIDTPTC